MWERPLRDHRRARRLRVLPLQELQFCSACGSPIFAYLDASPDVLRIRLGSLDTPFTKQPKAHTSVGDKSPWEPIGDDLPQFQE